MKKFKTKKKTPNVSKYWSKFGCGTLATVLLLSSVTLSGCGKKQEDVPEEEKKTKIMVETSSVGSRTISIFSDFIGSIEASEETIIMPKVAGEVTEKYFEVGDNVNAGDLLFTIDDTALQLTKTSAEATLQSAQATLENAQAGLTAQQATNASTQASVAETLGTMDTTEMELDANVDKAQKAVGAAKAGQGLSAQTFSTYQNAADDAKDTKESVEDQKGYQEDYLENLEGKMDTANSIKNVSSLEDAQSLALSHGVDASSATSIDQVTDAYISANSSYTNYSALSAALSAAKAQYESSESTLTSMEGAYDAKLLAQIQAAISVETGKDSVETAEQALELVKKYKEDYENFTKNKINAAVNAQLVGAEASLASSNSNVKTASASLTNAKVSLASAELQLDYTKVKTPVSGVIQAINVSKYNMASQSTQAYIISSEDSKKITFYVAETAMRNMREGQSATVEKDGVTYKATISHIENTVDSAKGLFKVEALVTGQKTAGFITGTTVKLSTATQQSVDAMTVPIDAVYYDDEQAYVYCLQNGTAVRTDIETGIADEEAVEVKSGLTADSKIITSWASQLKDGASVYEAEQKENQEAVTEEVTEEPVEEKIVAESADTAEEIVETTDKVNIRSEASQDAEKLGVALAGERYTRLETTEDGWSKILFQGKEAYIKSDYVKTVDTDQEENVNE